MRDLILVLSNPFSIDNPALACEATQVWSHQARITLFLSAMRHCAELLRQQGLPLDYNAVDDQPDAAPRLRPPHPAPISRDKQLLRRLPL